MLDEINAVQLLGRLAGDNRVAVEPDAARRIASLCGWLPLALRIAGARLAARPAWPLRLLADRLSDRYRRLDELAVGDLGVRASIDLSYQALNERDRRGFRLLGALGMPDVTSWISARLLGETDGLLERLVDVQLLEFAGVDVAGELHYRFHDLVRLFAEERAAAEESEEEERLRPSNRPSSTSCVADTQRPGGP